MSVLVSNQEVGPCRHELTIEVPGPAVSAETQRVVGDYRRRAKIPGFRKGKAPSGMVQRHFADEIEQEVLDRLVPRYWNQAQAEAQLDALAPPRVSKVDLELGASLRFVATVETRPDLRIGDLPDLDLPERGVEATEVEIEDAVMDLRRRGGTWNAVDRAASQGDSVEAMVEPILDETAAPEGEEGEEVPTPEPQKVEAEVGREGVWEEFSTAVTGLSAGQSTEFSRVEGEGETAVERRFKVEVTAVKELELPELDDAFAQSLGEAEGVEALTRRIGESIRAGKADALARERETAALDQLRERFPVALPDGVVDHEVEHLLTDYAQNLAARGMNLETAELDWAGLRDEARPQAEKQVHARLLLDAVAKEQEIHVGEDEVEAAIASIARAERRPVPAVRKDLAEAGRLEGLRSQLQRRTALRLLLGEEVAEEAPEAASGDESSTDESAEQAAAE